MAPDRWEWTLPGSARVAASIEGGTEYVFVGGIVKSQSARGEKPEGHMVEIAAHDDDAPRTVIVKFDPRAKICVLTFDGLEVSPAMWPTTKKPVATEAPQEPFPFRTIAAAVIASSLLMAFILFVRTRSTAKAETDDTMSGLYRAPNGRFVAHFPSAFTTRPAVAPRPAGGVVIEDRARGDAVLLFAAPVDETQREMWGLHKRLYGEALANIPRANGDHEETKREEGTCLGQPAALTVARVTNAKGEKARLSACAFTHKGAGYFLAFALRENAVAEDEKRIARIVEATELTELSDISDQKP